MAQITYTPSGLLLGTTNIVSSSVTLGIHAPGATNNYIHLTNGTTGTSGSDGAQIGITSGAGVLEIIQSENQNIRILQNTNKLIVLENNTVSGNSIVELKNVTDHADIFLGVQATPEASIVASPGDLYIRADDGGNAGSIWIKGSGIVTNTGWLQLSTGTATGFWDLTGNTGQTAGVDNFLGSTDSVPINIITDGITRMYVENVTGRIGIGTTTPTQQLEITQSFEQPHTSSSSVGVVYKGADRFIHDYDTGGVGAGQNTFMGTGAGNFTHTGTGLTAYGYNALANVTTGNTLLAFGNGAGTGLTTATRTVLIGNMAGSASDCVAIGFNAMSAGTGGTNTIIGSGAGQSSTTGNNNTYIGYNAGTATLGGNSNVAVGSRAMDTSTGGAGNVIVGTDSMNSHASGLFITTLGYRSLDTTTGGDEYVALGYEALASATNANASIAIGSQALKVDSAGLSWTGTHIIGIGKNSRVGGSGLTNSIVIGKDAVVSASNNMILGPGGGGFGTRVNVGIGVNTANAPLHVHSLQANTVNILRLENNANNFDIFTSTATPEGAITGTRGDLCSVDDGANGQLYLKQTGAATNTGWVQLSTGGSKSYFSGVIASLVGVTRYYMINNSFTAGFATESTVQVPSFAGNYTTLRINVSTNTATSAVTVNFRVNGAGAGPTISIPAATTGILTNTTTATVSANDLVTIEVVGAAVGTVTFGYQLEFIPS